MTTEHGISFEVMKIKSLKLIVVLQFYECTKSQNHELSMDEGTVGKVYLNKGEFLKLFVSEVLFK